MLTRQNILCCLFSLILVGYLVVALITSEQMQAAALSPANAPVRITVQGEDSIHFVTRSEVADLISDYIPATDMRPWHVNTQQIEDLLDANDNIESVRCTRRSDDRLWVEVTPMQPVARVFDDTGSYYINRQGKRLVASLKYRCDVPVVVGDLTGHQSASQLMPLLDYLKEHKDCADMVTAIKLEPNGDVKLIPPFRGHLINFGAPNVDIDDKFDRLITMYRTILPVKGWDFYSELSVKFKGQVVAKRRKARQRDPLMVIDPTGDASDNEDVATMTVET